MKSGKAYEVLRFVITGAICFLVEFVLLIILKSVFHIDTLLATPFAFIISVIVNYILCLKWVFQGTKDNGNKTRILFLITSIVGLLLNELLMYLFRIILGEDEVLFVLFGLSVNTYMVNKTLATLLVMIWNYFSKRIVLKQI